jgi:hypothetical protein
VNRERFIRPSPGCDGLYQNLEEVQGLRSGKVNDGRKFAFLDRHFNTFSEYGTHPSSTAIIAHFDGTRLHIGPHFNEALYRYTIRDLAILSWHVTDACGDAYLKLFHVSVADLYPAETHRFVRSQSSIAPMQPEL